MLRLSCFGLGAAILIVVICFLDQPKQEVVPTALTMPVVLEAPRLPADLVEERPKVLDDLRPGESCFANVTALKRRRDGSLFLSSVCEQLAAVDKTVPYLVVRRGGDGSWHVTLYGNHRYPESLFGDLPVSSFTWDRGEKR